MLLAKELRRLKRINQVASKKYEADTVVKNSGKSGILQNLPYDFESSRNLRNEQEDIDDVEPDVNIPGRLVPLLHLRHEGGS